MVDRPMQDYEKGKMLNKGAFGSAFLARCKKTDTMVVIKMVDISKCSKKERDSARKEVSILGAMKHPNIIEYKNSFEDGGFLCIVMAFAEGGDLTGKIKNQMALKRGFSEDQILDWFVQICLGLKHVHDRKILHRDLKSQNIFLTGSQKIIKLGDFGIAKVLDATNGFAKTSIGTPYYLVCITVHTAIRKSSARPACAISHSVDILPCASFRATWASVAALCVLDTCWKVDIPAKRMVPTERVLVTWKSIGLKRGGPRQ